MGKRGKKVSIVKRVGRGGGGAQRPLSPVRFSRLPEAPEQVGFVSLLQYSPMAVPRT